MKAVAITLCLFAAGCAANRYNGPTAAQLASLCRAEGHSMRTLGACLENKLEKAYPGWREKDEDSAQVVYLLAFADALGKRETDGTITDKEAFDAFKNENNSLVAQKFRRKAEESAQQQARQQAVLNAAMIWSATYQPRQYAPQAPLVPYPSDTTIVVQPQQQYRFIDSSPYRR